MVRALTGTRARESVDESLDRFIVRPDAFLQLGEIAFAQCATVRDAIELH
jgi:hypothetical protein